MSVEKRLLELAASFADDVSHGGEKRFKDRVMAFLETSSPPGIQNPRTAQGAGLRAGPRGGGEAVENS